MDTFDEWFRYIILPAMGGVALVALVFQVHKFFKGLHVDRG